MANKNRQKAFIARSMSSERARPHGKMQQRPRSRRRRKVGVTCGSRGH